MTEKKEKRAWRKWYWLLIAAPFTITGFVLYVLYAHKYDRTGLQVLSWFMVMCFPFALQMNYLEIESGKWYRRILNGLTAVICVAPFMGGMIWAQVKYTRTMLRKYPVEVTAHITALEAKRHKGAVSHYAIFEYSLDNKQYHQQVSNDDERYVEGDTLSLVVSAKDPEIFAVRKFQ